MMRSPPNLRRNPGSLRISVLLFVLLFSHLLSPANLRAHSRTISYSKWVETDTGWSVQARLPVLELERRFGKGGWGEETARTYTLERFRARTAEGPCTPQWIGGSARLTDFVANWTLHCNSPTRELHIEAFFDTAPSHLHYARVHRGRKIQEQIVTAASPLIPMVRDESQRLFADYFNSGLKHLLAGLDHVFFIAGLVLLAGSLISLLKIVTAFTIAHAVSLTALALGLVKAAPRSVEALVGLSIFVIAAEVFIRCSPARQARQGRVALCVLLLLAVIPAALGVFRIAPLALFGFALINLSLLGLGRKGEGALIPWIHASVFGLIHGMAIAGTLGTLDRGVGDGSILRIVLGFNLGVEFGQALIAVVLFFLFSGLVRMLEYPQLTKGYAREAAASALIAVGTYWFVGRALM